MTRSREERPHGKQESIAAGFGEADKGGFEGGRKNGPDKRQVCSDVVCDRTTDRERSFELSKRQPNESGESFD